MRLIQQAVPRACALSMRFDFMTRMASPDFRHDAELPGSMELVTIDLHLPAALNQFAAPRHQNGPPNPTSDKANGLN